MLKARAALLGAASSLVTVAAVVPSVGHATGACSSDWPMFQHDQARTASATCSGLTTTDIPTLAPRWFLPTNGGVTAEPAVVDGVAYVGDSIGEMHAIDMSSGKEIWPAPFSVTSNSVHDDAHAASYGLITSSAAVADIASTGPTVFFGGGGTVYALDAASGTPRWATDIGPSQPGSSAEVESSPVVWTHPDGRSVVFVGMDTNEDRGKIDGGVVALDAATGALLWKYDADNGTVVHDLVTGSGHSTGCGDIWSSPALDPARRTLFFGGGNCDLAAGGDTERLIAVNADSGHRLWEFAEPAGNHQHDQDFGASPVLTTLGRTDVVVQAGKSGWVYAVNRVTGRLVSSVHAAQGSAIGGFIGSVAVAPDPTTGHPMLYGDTAVPLSDDPSEWSVPADSPTRLASLHAVDLATGTTAWDAPAQTPSYSPVTVVNGIVFAPDTTQFSADAYDASTGLPLWRLPVAAATSGGVAVSGSSVVFGVGTFLNQDPQAPPQSTGVWCFAPPV